MIPSKLYEVLLEGVYYTLLLSAKQAVKTLEQRDQHKAKKRKT